LKAGFVSREAYYSAVDDYEHFCDTEDEVGDEGDERTRAMKTKRTNRR